MQAYTGFAAVYDTFMDNIPYEEWCEYLTGLLKEQGVTEGLLLDLGCGTGSLTELLADAGYDMIGVDNSEEMLELALEKKEQSGKDILYLCQDMREFELYPRRWDACKKAITKGMAKNPQWKITRYTNGDGERAMQWWLSGKTMADYFGQLKLEF